MIVLQISIYRPDGKLAAMMVQTQMVLPRESEQATHPVFPGLPAKSD
jgi:hypothetical protein